MQSQIITIEPTIENCDPVRSARRSQPLEYGLQEAPILYAGGRKWLLTASSPAALRHLALSHQRPLDTDVFVLNNGLVLWCSEYRRGLTVPTAAISQYWLARGSDEKLQLHLLVRSEGVLKGADCSSSSSHLDGSISNDFPGVTQLTLTPMFWENDRYYNDKIERLFTFEHFGHNRGEKMLNNVFHALNLITSQGVSEQLDCNITEATAAEFDDTRGYVNTGRADDIDTNNCYGTQMMAGTGVEFDERVSRKNTRRRDESRSEESPTKRLKS